MVIKASKKIVLATANDGKIREFQDILANVSFNIISQKKIGIVSCAETGLTFVENAIIKARNASMNCGLSALADDSGLVIDALQGQPGILSARYAGEDASMNDNIAQVLWQMQDVPEEQRTAHFCCVIVYLRYAQDPSPIICQGEWHGKILTEKHGKNGFGYDPIFFVPSHSCSAAELPSEIKNKISHRALALRQLIKAFG